MYLLIWFLGRECTGACGVLFPNCMTLVAYNQVDSTVNSSKVEESSQLLHTIYYSSCMHARISPPCFIQSEVM